MQGRFDWVWLWYRPAGTKHESDAVVSKLGQGETVESHVACRRGTHGREGEQLDMPPGQRSEDTTVNAAHAREADHC